MNKAVNKDFSRIRLFAMDVDGTLTDGKIYMGDTGEMMKAFDVKDGLGIKLLMAQGIIPAIITGRRSRIVENRCREIGITEIHQGVRKKDSAFLALMDRYQLIREETAYIGDDINDLGAMREAGITFAPADCARQLLPFVDVHLSKKAGDCPVREAIDLILEGRYKAEDFCEL